MVRLHRTENGRRLTALLCLAIWQLLGAGSAPAQERFSFEASNVPGQFLRHRNDLADLTAIASELDRADATFRIGPALNGAAGAVSFETANSPFSFLRHQNFRLRMDLHVTTPPPLFLADASFYVRPGLIGGDTVSYEAVNVPGHFIRHRNFQFWVDRNDNSDLFRRDASFHRRPPLDHQLFSLEASNVPGHYIRHRNSLGEISPISSDLDRADATFAFLRALSGTRIGNEYGLTFETSNFPGMFLRHQNFRLRIDRGDRAALFRLDASYIVRPGLADPAGMSFEATNVPGGFFIRHRNFQLWLDRNDNSDLFRRDATFYRRPPVTTSAPSPVLTPIQQLILDQHNAERANHCAPALTWSAAAAAAAQVWVNTCTMNSDNTRFEHDPNRAPYGENMSAIASSPTDPTHEEVVRNAHVGWYDNEEPLYNYNNPVFADAYGHFTQIAWLSTRQVGCAFGACPCRVGGCVGRNYIRIVCRYLPSGNVDGQFAQNVLPRTCRRGPEAPSPAAPPPTPSADEMLRSR